MNGHKLTWAAIGGMWVIIVMSTGVIYKTIDGRLAEIENTMKLVVKNQTEAAIRRSFNAKQDDEFRQRLEALERKK
jgi:hypothetical protein